ncbi:mycofactocin system GMC family oxidoreductase MftG [Microbacterium sp. X-17]|uniref:mycofactocin dehydrogenase MftG n=1 Tax=Microbacterium sp. X-17 TaxID=3144404 RepID=UPI0031F5C3FA
MTRTVVVGAGASGAVLAARLSEDPAASVVLVEAGPDPRPFPAELLDGTTIQGARPGHPASAGFPAELAPGHPFTLVRGRIVGGSSAINGGVFIRARPADFDGWASVGGEAWSYARMLPILRALEDDRDYGATEWHGGSGPIPVRRPRTDAGAVGAFVAAARAAGFADDPDKNAPGAPGVGPVPSNVIDGIRVNAAHAYLDPVRDRPNLRILAGTRVRRVLIESGRAVGLDTDRGIVEADEVVLCAGALGTAHLLLHSGIGPRGDLEGLGLPVVADLPVGEGFSDHPQIAVGWRPAAPLDPVESTAFPVALHARAGGEHPDGDLELLFAARTIGELLAGRANASAIPRGSEVQLLVGLQTPASRGRLSLRSADPLVPSRIEFRYLASAEDLERLRVGVRMAAALLSSSAFAGIADRLTELGDAVLDDDARLDAWLRAHLGTALHTCGTARMGDVVDGSGRVHGIRGLRVADLSMLPVVPSRGPAATAVAIGELAAGLIRDGA